MLRRNGFTMVELLVVMGIILVLMAIALPAVNNGRTKAKNVEVKAGCNTVQKALEQFAVDNSGGYPGAHYVTNGNAVYSGPGVIGGLPTYDGNTPRKDFFTAKQASDARGPNNGAPTLAAGVSNPDVTDALVEAGYLTDYPANPFLRTSSGTKAQMSNLFLFNPGLSTSTAANVFPIDTNRQTLDWNRYTGQNESMRVMYDDFGRGHFSYIPLNPVNNAGINYEAQWGALSDVQRSEFYKRCRGYMLIGWGASRADDSEGKGLSEKFWRNDLNGTGGFDFDADGKVDLLERYITSSNFLTPEMRDSSGSSSGFGGTTLGIKNIDTLFSGATFIKIAGS
jgi:prepilin-type N-terminal cleavage/methylation domain-containing protein